MFRKKRTPYYQEIAAFIEEYYIQPSAEPEVRIGNAKRRHFKREDSESKDSRQEAYEDQDFKPEGFKRQAPEDLLFECKASGSEDYEDKDFECEGSERQAPENLLFECKASGIEDYEDEDFECEGSVNEDFEDEDISTSPSTSAFSRTLPNSNYAPKADLRSLPTVADPHRGALPRLEPEEGKPEHTFLCAGTIPSTLEETLNQVDESFQEMLLRKIDESGMTDAQCYRKAHIDRRLFSKIRNNPQYQPSRQTVIAFGIALELPLDEMKDLLMKAGFALSHASKADLIVEFFIRRGNYNLYEINEALSAFGQTLLGA